GGADDDGQARGAARGQARAQPDPVAGDPEDGAGLAGGEPADEPGGAAVLQDDGPLKDGAGWGGLGDFYRRAGTDDGGLYIAALLR
ncbi:MAG: hypothetical protein RMK65_12405, partial [Anaerolineae bacterium]|nr:hypothetical protein [Anaerolineae bacterium]